MWLADPNFDWGDQLAKKYMKYHGKYYDVGTKVRIKSEGKIIEATFLGWSSDRSFDCEFYGSKTYKFSCVDKYIVEIIEPVYPKLTEVPTTATNPNAPPSWEIEIGWVWYILIMVVGVIFKDRWIIWIAATIYFFVWKSGLWNGGNK